MTAKDEHILDAEQLEALGQALHRGAADASIALGKWFKKPTQITLDAVEQLSLHDATSVLGDDVEPICFCAVQMTGYLTGHLILAFDDASGLALADMLLGQKRGTAREWLEMETSAALETTNILCCAYLNSLSRAFAAVSPDASGLIPTPPRFSRDFAGSLIQSALMGQVMTADHALLARTRFEIDGAPANWTLLCVPDAESMSALYTLLK